MNSIKINLKTTTPLSEKYLREFLQACESSRYFIDIEIFDYSLVKNIINALEKAAIDSPMNVRSVLITDMPFEEKEQGKGFLVENAAKKCGSYDAVLNISSEVQPCNNWLDHIDDSVFDDEYTESIYCDYYISNGKEKVHIFQKSQPVANGTIPALILSTGKIKEVYEKAKGEADIVIFQNFVSKHIPYPLFLVTQNV